MRRTIEMRQEDAYYKGRKIDYVSYFIRKYFELRNSRVFQYVITIVEDSFGEFTFSAGRSGKSSFFDLYRGGSYAGSLCQGHFKKLFFTPDYTKKYNVVIKKVRKKKAKKCKEQLK